MTPGKKIAFSDALDRLVAFGRAPPRVRAAPPHDTTLTATLRECHVWCKKVLGLSQWMSVGSSLMTVLTSCLWVQEDEEVDEAAAAIIG